MHDVRNDCGGCDACGGMTAAGDAPSGLRLVGMAAAGFLAPLFLALLTEAFFRMRAVPQGIGAICGLSAGLLLGAAGLKYMTRRERQR